MLQTLFSAIRSRAKLRYSIIILFPVLAFAASATRFDDVIVKNSVSIGSYATPNSKSILDLSSTTKGFLLPRMTTVQKNNISSPTTGLEVFDSTTGYLNYYNGSAWRELSSLAGSETLTNKTLDNTNTITLKDTLFTLQDDGDTSKQAKFQLSGITTATTRTWTLPDATDTFVGLTSTQSPTNKTFDNTNTVTLKDTLFTLQDDGDTTKQIKFQASSVTTATTRTWTFPDVTDTFVGLTASQTVTNKTLTAPVIDTAVMDGQASTPASPSAGYYKLYVKDSDNKLYSLTSGGVESLVGGSGGGGGATVLWEEPANAPAKSIINNAAVYSYGAGLSHELYTEIKVPSSYTAGGQINLKCNIYSADSSGTFLMQTVSTLIRNNTDAVSSTTNQRTSTNAAITASGANQNKIQTVTFDLTSSGGEVNSVAVAAGDTLLIKMTRGSDSATGNVAFLYKQCEVSL